MKKQEQKLTFNPGPINSFIIKLNRPSFMLLITSYIAILVLIIFLISPSGKGKTIVPNYNHQLFPEDIHPQINLIANYNYNKDTKKVDLRYNVTATVQGRFNASGLDPHLLVNRFMLSSYLTADKMKYFTEQSGHKTQITHSYTLDNTSSSQVPQTFYTILKYEDVNGVSKTATYKEDVMLELKNREYFTHDNAITHVDGEMTIKDVRVNFGVTEEVETYTFSTRITLSEYAKPYHIDMQSWIVSSEGEAYPFIGVYGYQDEDSAFAYGNRAFPKQLNPKYIFCKLDYYLPNAETQTILYRVLISDLPNNTGIEPTYTDIITAPKSFPWDKVNMIAWPALVGITIGGVIYYFNKKKKQNI